MSGTSLVILAMYMNLNVSRAKLMHLTSDGQFYALLLLAIAAVCVAFAFWREAGPVRRPRDKRPPVVLMARRYDWRW